MCIVRYAAGSIKFVIENADDQCSVREFDDHGTHVAFDAQLEKIESSSRAPTIGEAF